MRVEEAIEISSVKSAFRPYITDPVNMEDQKYIVCRELLDYYLVYADTFRYIRQLGSDDAWKIIGKSDWEPIAPV